MESIAGTIGAILAATWDLLLDASLYILIGLLLGGMLRFFLSPRWIVAHLGTGRFRSVLKAALLGIPLPLCSCGVVPTAAALKRMGASNGATIAFLVSTPESGVDSIAVSWALLDPLLTVIRPVAAFITALVAGVSENLLHPPRPASLSTSIGLALASDGADNRAGGGKEMVGLGARLREGTRYALVEMWGDLAASFYFGLLLAGIVAVLVPEEFLQGYLGSGLPAMLLMLLFGIPLYICATASTPIAAAFLLKGVSPGAVLVFLLVGPATNIASLAVLVRFLGKRSTGVYLAAIAVVSVLCGLAVDLVYGWLGVSARAAAGQAAEITPEWLRVSAALIILAFSIRPLSRLVAKWLGIRPKGCGCSSSAAGLAASPAAPPGGQACGCDGHEPHPPSSVQGEGSKGTGAES